MKQVPFRKYTVYGNNFVVVDATRDNLLSETEMMDFARIATRTEFGIGSDNLLVIQCCDRLTLEQIAETHDYWDKVPDSEQADFIFRMFEPNGDEALCCGNGLICIADYLHDCYGIDAASILTEVPLAKPRVRSLGYYRGGGHWVEMGAPRQAPAEVVSLDAGSSRVHDAIDEVEALTIQLPSGHGMSQLEDGAFAVSGYLVFTGEPHLVVFAESGISHERVADALFARDSSASSPSFDSWLVQQIGDWMNTQYRHLFPMGININFACRQDPGSVAHRCYERGINRETLACGTGALAVAYVAQQVLGQRQDVINVLPYLSLLHDAEACIRVQRTPDGWRLNARATFLFEGRYQFPVRAPQRPLSLDHDEIEPLLPQTAALMPEGR